MSLRCPVLSGNYDGVYDQLGEAALIFDNLDENDLAEKINLLLTDDNMKNDLIQKGLQKVAEIGDFDSYVEKAITEINKFENIIRMWKDV